MRNSIFALFFIILLLSGCAKYQQEILEFQEDEMTEEEYNRYMEEYRSFCPYGDAVIINRIEQELAGDNAVSISVDCINYDSENKLWITWRGNLRGDKLLQRWKVNEYNVYTADGELIIKDNKVIVLPTEN